MLRFGAGELAHSNFCCVYQHTYDSSAGAVLSLPTPQSCGVSGVDSGTGHHVGPLVAIHWHHLVHFVNVDFCMDLAQQICASRRHRSWPTT